MVAFKEKADRIIKERWGIEVQHVRAKRTCEDLFYQVHTKGNHIGDISGWPLIHRCKFQSLKLDPIKGVENVHSQAISYIGIAADEVSRFHNLDGKRKKSPLVEAGWTEQDCYEWAKKNDLLSPIYETSRRGGCWLCPAQGVDQLRQLRKRWPRYWDIMLKWDKDSPVSFKPDGRFVRDYDKRFWLEEQGLLPEGRFLWRDVDDYVVTREEKGEEVKSNDN